MIKMAYPEIIEKIKEASSIAESEIEERIKNKMSMLSGLISKEGAAYIVANELGVKLVQTSGMLQIKNVLVGMRSVETAGKVMRKFPINEFERNGKPGKVGSFIIADESGQLRVTAWHDMTDQLSRFSEGDIVKIIGGYVRENNGAKEIHLNSNSKLVINPEGITINIKVMPAGADGQTGTGTAQEAMQKAERKKISDLTESDSNIEIFGTVVQVFDPRFYPVCPQCNRKAEQTGSGFRCAEHGAIEADYSFVINAFIDDGSDNIRVVFFRNQALNLFKQTKEQMLAYKNAPETFDRLKTELLGEQVKVIGRVTKNEMFDRLEMIARVVFRDIEPEQEIARLKASSPAQQGISVGSKEQEEYRDIPEKEKELGAAGDQEEDRDTPEEEEIADPDKHMKKPEEDPEDPEEMEEIKEPDKPEDRQAIPSIDDI
ncbi:hypothetical protein JXB31_01255 [Candidatus Woesearchaeota archaeon]|nr:hypothetical protein [Candidatus Woesearchaeota archaeon]